MLQRKYSLSVLLLRPVTGVRWIQVFVQVIMTYSFSSWILILSAVASNVGFRFLWLNMTFIAKTSF